MKTEKIFHKRFVKPPLPIIWLVLSSVFLTLLFSGCIVYHPLRLSQLREFERDVHKKYPFAAVSCKYEHAGPVTITVNRSSFDEECAYTILGCLQPIVRDEDFIRDLFDSYERRLKDTPYWETWKSGWRPEIYLSLDANRYTRYQFSTRATKEGYNSGYAPDSYTWDGYTTWYGTEYVDHVPREITPEEIEEAVKRYSED